MELPIPLQLARACAAVLCGAALGLWYDLLRLPRLLFAPARAPAAAADLVFCLGAAAALFALGLGPGGGQLRLYMCVCAALGFCLWRAGPGRLLACGEARAAFLLRQWASQRLSGLKTGEKYQKKFRKCVKKYLHFGEDRVE